VKQSKINNEVRAATIKISLRCPLSYARIQTPVRFRNCNHLQCIDETSWKSVVQDFTVRKFFSLNCPLCSKTVRGPFDGFIDGFFVEILQKMNESVDEVIVDVENGCSYAAVGAQNSVALDLDTKPTTSSWVCNLLSDSGDFLMQTTGVPLLSNDAVGVIELLFDEDISIPSTAGVLPAKRFGSSINDAIIL